MDSGHEVRGCDPQDLPWQRYASETGGHDNVHNGVLSWFDVYVRIVVRLCLIFTR